jgi:hypothetical protein
LVHKRAFIPLNTIKKAATCYTSYNFFALHSAVKNTEFISTTIKPQEQPCSSYLGGLETDLKENSNKVTAYHVNYKTLIFLTQPTHY